MSARAARVAEEAWSRWLAGAGPLDRVFGGLVRSARLPAPVSAAGWQRVSAAARFAGFLAARRDLGRWLASRDPRAEVAAIPDFWRRVDALRADPEPADRARWRAGDPSEQVAAAGVAGAWVPAIAARFGDRCSAFLRALDTAPPLWIRARRPDEVGPLVDALRGEGFRVGRIDGLALEIAGEHPIHATAAAREGRLEVQDLASQQVVDALPLAGPVWDACAGEGGKTLALAARLGGRSAVVASDVHAGRLATLRRRVARAGWQNVRVVPWDGGDPPPPHREAARGFALVLVDAPCSACGTWRRNPEVRLSLPASPELLALQARLLSHAARRVRPGGALAWATCSFDPRENEAQVAQLAWPSERAGLHGAPDHDADTLFLAVARAPG